MDFKTKIKEIGKILGFGEENQEVTFKDAKLMDGETIVHIEGEVYEQGVKIDVLDEAGELTPLMAGEYELEDGTKLILIEDGVIDSVEVVESEEEAPEEEAPIEMETETETESETETENEEEDSEEDSNVNELKVLEERITSIEDLLKSIADRQESFSEASELMFSVMKEISNSPIKENISDIQKFSSYKKDVRTSRERKMDIIAKAKNNKL